MSFRADIKATAMKIKSKVDIIVFTIIIFSLLSMKQGQLRQPQCHTPALSITLYLGKALSPCKVLQQPLQDSNLQISASKADALTVWRKGYNRDWMKVVFWGGE